MAFPTPVPANHVTHGEGGEVFFAMNGRWQRKQFPDTIKQEIANLGNSQITFPSDMASGHNLIDFQVAFETTEVCDLQMGILTKTGWVPKNNYKDVRQFVWWSDGSNSGIHAQNSGKASWGSSTFFPYIRDGTRRIKNGKPQILKCRLVNGDDKVFVSWSIFVTCVTGDSMMENYGRLNIICNLDDVRGFYLDVTNGQFDVGFASIQAF